MQYFIKYFDTPNRTMSYSIYDDSKQRLRKSISFTKLPKEINVHLNSLFGTIQEIISNNELILTHPHITSELLKKEFPELWI